MKKEALSGPLLKIYFYLRPLDGAAGKSITVRNPM